MAEVATRHIQDHHGHVQKKESAYRRSNKPLMEKKRRARINSCLTQLKALVLQSMRKDSTQYSKLEKADILEMTVKHLRNLQRQQVATAMSHDPTVVTKYREGFSECAQEVVRYLSSAQDVNTDVRGRLLTHLGSCMDTVDVGRNSKLDQKEQNYSQPINVHIPTPHVNIGLTSVQSGCLLMPANIQTSPIVAQTPRPILSQGHVTGQHGQCTNTLHVQSPAETIKTGVCGSFQIVPNSTGAVAVYLGQSQNPSPANTTTNAVPLYSNCAAKRTKASLKAFDRSAFSKVEKSENLDDDRDQPPAKKIKSIPTMDVNNNGVFSNCNRTPCPLNEDNVWRPW